MPANIYSKKYFLINKCKHEFSVGTYQIWEGNTSGHTQRPRVTLWWWGNSEAILLVTKRHAGAGPPLRCTTPQAASAAGFCSAVCAQLCRFSYLSFPSYNVRDSILSTFSRQLIRRFWVLPMGTGMNQNTSSRLQRVRTLCSPSHTQNAPPSPRDQEGKEAELEGSVQQTRTQILAPPSRAWWLQSSYLTVLNLSFLSFKKKKYHQLISLLCKPCPHPTYKTYKQWMNVGFLLPNIKD